MPIMNCRAPWKKLNFKTMHLKNQLTIQQRFIEYCRKEKLILAKDRLLVAVSGGLDSVVLAELCRQSGFDFSIAHCNFQLRGDDSLADAAFVNQLAQKYKVPYFEKTFETQAYAASCKISIQEAARELRYEWFETLTDPRTGGLFDKILTAHHADDNMETIVMNFFKGSGINGLKGILPLRDRIARPLLFARKEELAAFMTAHQLTWREDVSNSSDKYTRNYFRNSLLPAIEKVYPEVKHNLLANAARFRDLHELYNDATSARLNKMVKKEGDSQRMPVLLLLQQPALNTLLYEWIHPYGFTSAQVDEAKKLLESESGKFTRSATHTLLRNRKWLLLFKTDGAENHQYLAEETTDELPVSGGIFTFTTKKPVISHNLFEAGIDLSQIQFPLLIRRWKKGDYFYPLGMKKKKKLSRFFIDQKLSMKEKEQVWVIESNKKIAWIAGLRLDDRFRITPATTRSLHINWIPSK